MRNLLSDLLEGASETTGIAEADSENRDDLKQRGGYYTPLDLACFMSRFVLSGPLGETDSQFHILEPSCGDGIFIQAVGDIMNHDGAGFPVTLEAIEKDAVESRKSRKRLEMAGDLIGGTVTNTDFLDYASSLLRAPEAGRKRVDAVLGNPPYIRFQRLDEQQKADAALIHESMNLPARRNGSIWVTFVLASLELLKCGGRLAMIVPAEIFSVSCVAVLRNHLLRTCRRIVLIEPETLWFPKTSQGTVMLLAEKKGHDDHLDDSRPDGSLSVISVRNREFLSCDPDILFETGSQTCSSSTGTEPVFRSCDTTIEGPLKWSWYLLDGETRALIDRIVAGNEVMALGELAQVELGVVTGANDFFIVPDAVIEEYGLHDWTYPCISKARHVPGCIHDTCQHEQLQKDGEPVNLFDFRTGDRAGSGNGISDAVKRYIFSGEGRGFHKRYKCRIRSPWFHLPPFRRPSLAMLIQGHEINRMCLNQNNAVITNSLFSIEPGDSISPATLALLYHNPLTALHAEILGRCYGGGVLQLMPTEARNLPVPVPASVMNLPDAEIMRNLYQLDRAMRRKRAEGISIHDVIKHQGDLIGQALGLTATQRSMILSAWNLMRNRRHRKG